MAETGTEYVLMQDSAENRMALQCKDQCDKYDYLAAVACGAVGGLIDIFFVGAPGESGLETWSDARVDNAVKRFASMNGWKPREGQEGNIASAIGYLERRFKINYDQRHTGEVGGMFRMTTKNHHIMSLAHAPDIIGLFFSVLAQFTSTAPFAAGGQVIMIQTDTYELQGGNFAAKLFCGVANWFGHVMSDMAGSSGSRGSGGRGTGVVIPFYEMFQFCRFGSFQVGKDRQELATIAVRAFQEGYDFRFGVAMAIPVVVTDLSIRLIWALRRHFQYGFPVKECIPAQRHADLRVMLLLGNGTLCIMDGMDAALRSGGNFLKFFMRLNLIAWFRLAVLALREVCIRVGLRDALTETIEAFRRMNEALLSYLHELEALDLDGFRRETEAYNQVITVALTAHTEEELTAALLDAFDRMGLKKPWEGDFDAHMSDKNAALIFE